MFFCVGKREAPNSFSSARWASSRLNSASRIVTHPHQTLSQVTLNKRWVKVVLQGCPQHLLGAGIGRSECAQQMPTQGLRAGKPRMIGRQPGFENGHQLIQNPLAFSVRLGRLLVQEQIAPCVKTAGHGSIIRRQQGPADFERFANRPFGSGTSSTSNRQ